MIITNLIRCELDNTSVMWMYTWLQNHTQRVIINGSFLNCVEVTSEIPQGSVLTPGVFNIINDLDQRIQGMLIKCVDDTKLGRMANTLQDRNKIQKDLDSLEHWAENSRMKFNKDKSTVLLLGGKKQQHPNAHYKLGNAWLSNITSTKNLGVAVVHKYELGGNHSSKVTAVMEASNVPVHMEYTGGFM